MPMHLKKIMKKQIAQKQTKNNEFIPNLFKIEN